MKKLGLFIICLFLIIKPATAGTLSEWGKFLADDISLMRCHHTYDVYLPFYAWHNRLAYDQEHIDKYNENAWGFGLGISHINAENTWSGLYAMGFKDSNSYLETYFGYARQWNWTAGDENQWSAGVVYTLGLTQRHEYSYIPVPLPLPLVGVGYRNINLQAAYVPGIKNDGNVLFVFARFNFKL